MKYSSRKAVWVMAIALVAFLISAIVFSAFRNFEAPAKSGKTVYAQIVGYTRGASKAGANPHFIAKLQNGFIVHVRDDGHVPSDYRGQAMLDLSAGKSTGLPMYTLSETTVEMIKNQQ